MSSDSAVSREHRRDIFDRIYWMGGIICPGLMPVQILHQVYAVKPISSQVQIPATSRILPGVQRCLGLWPIAVCVVASGNHTKKSGQSCSCLKVRKTQALLGAFFEPPDLPYHWRRLFFCGVHQTVICMRARALFRWSTRFRITPGMTNSGKALCPPTPEHVSV
jgi:hypothetical protein